MLAPDKPVRIKVKSVCRLLIEQLNRRLGFHSTPEEAAGQPLDLYRTSDLRLNRFEDSPSAGTGTRQSSIELANTSNVRKRIRTEKPRQAPVCEACSRCWSW